MKTISKTQFEKQFKDKSVFEPILINAYFNLEHWSAKTIYISDQIDEITTVTYHRKTYVTLIPRKDTLKTTLEPHYETLKRIIGVDAPVISVFDKYGSKLLELSEPVSV